MYCLSRYYGLMCAALFLLTIAGCGGSSPSKEVVSTAIKKILPVNFTILDVKPLKEIPGLCEVVIETDKHPVVFYMDKKGNYIISGSVIDVTTKRNLAVDSMNKYQQAKK